LQVRPSNIVVAQAWGVVLQGDEAILDNILKWADFAMYQAKDAGRNAICLYEGKKDSPILNGSPDLHSLTTGRHLQQSSYRRATELNGGYDAGRS
jgi:predicted signal transduction protein with EAL and GGDEF domain